MDRDHNWRDTVRAAQLDRMSQAEDRVRTAIAEYQAVVSANANHQRLVGDERPLWPTEITYAQSPVGLDTGKYLVGSSGNSSFYVKDETFAAAAAAEHLLLEKLLLSLSPHWEDRIRAEALSLVHRNVITLPDGFPCIYEPADSPKNERVLHPRAHAWVISPDEDMLRELLPLYRELWDAYESQWPSSPNRTFEVGRLNGVTPHGVYRPGTTPAEVIGATMLTHTDMYRTAPLHLREMHPLHAQWTAQRTTTRTN